MRAVKSTHALAAPRPTQGILHIIDTLVYQLTTIRLPLLHEILTQKCALSTIEPTPTRFLYYLFNF